MATTKQKRVAKLVIENLVVDKPLTGGEIVENSGYGVSMKKNPQVILNSEGVQEELKILGFDPHEAKKVVAEILIGGENDTVKLKAADMIFKVHSTYAPEKSVSLNLNVSGNDEALKAAEQAYLERIDGTTGPTEST